MWEALATLSRNRPDPENQSLFLPCILGAQVISETVAEADSPEHVQIGIRHKFNLLIRTHVLNVRRQ